MKILLLFSNLSSYSGWSWKLVISSTKIIFRVDSIFTYFSLGKKLSFLQNLFCSFLHDFEMFTKLFLVSESVLTWMIQTEESSFSRNLICTYILYPWPWCTHMASADMKSTDIDCNRNNHITQTMFDVINYEKVLALGVFDSILFMYDPKIKTLEIFKCFNYNRWKFTVPSA